MDPTPPQFSATPFPPAPGHQSLAAIVFTDAVGFSARMQADEETTLRLLQRDFDTMRQACIEHRGLVLKSTGDGLLLYFSSAVKAVACAISIQRTFAAHQKTRPATENLTHRVGIHLGDVFVNEQDVMGDGVNIAARLQAEAEPGGICISQTVYDVVRNKLALQVTRLGPRELKNISQAIPIYRLVLEAQRLEQATGATTPPASPAVTRRRRARIVKVSLAAAALLALAWAGYRAVSAWQRGRAEERRDQLARTARGERLWPEPATAAMDRTLNDWRREIQERRSRALLEYDFGAMGAMLREPASPVAGKPEAALRTRALVYLEALFDWLPAELQHYDRQHPLVARELTGTAPKEIRVFVGRDRRLYYAEGGAVRQRDWNDLRPSVLATILCGAMLAADPAPPREAVQGAYVFAALYHLPEIPGTLRRGQMWGKTP